MAKLPSQVWRFGWVSFLADVSSEWIYPVLPLYLAATIPAAGIVLGVVEGAADLTSSLLKLGSGVWSDRSRRRLPWVTGGYALSGLAKALLALAPGAGGVLTARLLDRFGKGLRSTPRDAILADLVPKEQSGRAFGLHRAMDSGGAVVGALLAALTLALLPSEYLLVFLLAAIPGILAAVVTLSVREQERTPAERRAPSAGWLTPEARRALVPLTVFALGNSSNAFLLLRAADAGLHPVAIALAYAAFNAVYAGASYGMGRLSDRLGRRPLLQVGWGLYALVYAGLAWRADLLWPAMVVYGLHLALTDGVGKALLADVVPKETRGRGFGVFMALQGVGVLVAGIVAGVLWEVVSHEAALWVGAQVSGVALLLSPLLPAPPPKAAGAAAAE